MKNNLLSQKKILVIVAHPDDELLGIGGTLHHLSHNEACTIKVVILGEGITSRSENRQLKEWKTTLEAHKSNIETARKEIGYQKVSVYDFPDNRFDSVDLLDIIKIIEKEKTIFQPDIVFTHHGGDLNIDHQRTFESVMTTFRPLNGEKIETILTFETPSGTEWQASSDPRVFIPNLFIELRKEDIDAKTRAMESYEFEKREFPHPRSPKALEIIAQQRGIMIGCEYAEAFCMIRNILRLE